MFLLFHVGTSKIEDPQSDAYGSSYALLLLFSSEQGRRKGNFSGSSSTPISPKYRHFGTILFPVDIPGGFSCVHRAKKPAYRQAVSRVLRRRENEWEDMPGTGTSGRPALVKGLMPYDPVFRILIYK